MKIILDTHAFLWFINGDEKLSLAARTAIEKPVNQCVISIVSLWEMSIKSSIGKLEIPVSIQQFYEDYIIGNGISLLPIEPIHLDKLHQLPFHHKDPFDRLIIAQAQVENIMVISCDEYFPAYDIHCLW